MTDKKRTELNNIFVKVFNHILSWEEQSFKEMGISEITLRELHVIEAVYSLQESASNKMSEIAKYLAITPGSLTTAVNCLVKKGYLERQQSSADRRIVYIIPTPKAQNVNEMHQRFHQAMIKEITTGIDDKDINIVINILNNLHRSVADNKILRK